MPCSLLGKREEEQSPFRAPQQGTPGFVNGTAPVMMIEVESRPVQIMTTVAHSGLFFPLVSGLL